MRVVRHARRRGDHKLLHRTIDVVRADTEALRFNTAIAKLIELNNHVTELEATPRPTVAEALVLMASAACPACRRGAVATRLGHDPQRSPTSRCRRPIRRQPRRGPRSSTRGQSTARCVVTSPSPPTLRRGRSRQSPSPTPRSQTAIERRRRQEGDRRPGPDGQRRRLTFRRRKQSLLGESMNRPSAGTEASQAACALEAKGPPRCVEVGGPSCSCSSADRSLGAVGEHVAEVRAAAPAPPRCAPSRGCGPR